MISRQDLTIALAGVHRDDWQSIFEFVASVKAKASTTTITPEIRAYREQQSLVFDLKELYSLSNICRLAIEKRGQDETDSVSEVLMIVVNRLHEMHDLQGDRLKELDAIAYPEMQENGGAA